MEEPPRMLKALQIIGHGDQFPTGVKNTTQNVLMGCQEDFRHSKTVNPYSYLVGPFENMETY